MGTLNLNPNAPTVVAKQSGAGDPLPNDRLRRMDSARLRRLRQHSQIVAAMSYLAMGGLFLAAAFTLMSLILDERIWMLSAGGTVVTGYFFAVTYGLVKRPTWGRSLGIIHCATLLFVLIGWRGLIVIFESPELFGEERYAAKDIEHEWRRRKSTS